MFAKFAAFQAFSPGRRAPLAGGIPHCNDNRPARDLRELARRLPRPVLACRWHTSPTGRLECTWDLQRIGPASADDPAIRSRAA
jgi:hypothetical protein